MKKSLSTLTLLAFVTVLVVLLLPAACTPSATAAPAGTEAANLTPALVVGAGAPLAVPPIASAKPTCDDAVCNQWCIEQGGAFGFCRGNLCVCGI